MGFAQRIEAVNNSMTSCQLVMTRDGLAAVAAGQLDHLRKCLSTSTCSLPAASAAMHKLAACTWLSRAEMEELSALMKVSDEDNAEEEAASKGKHKNQSNDHFHNYLTEKDWSNLREAQSPVAKIQVLAGRCVAIGMRWPTEAAAKAVVAVAVACGTAETSAEDRLSMLHQLKHSLRSGRRTKTSVSSEHLLSFPPIDAFLREHSQIYVAGELPVACPLTDISLSDAAAAVPARRMNKALSGGAQPSPARSSRGDPTLALLAQLMQQLVPRGQAPAASLIQLRTPPAKRFRHEDSQLSLPPCASDTAEKTAEPERGTEPLAEAAPPPSHVRGASSTHSISDIAGRVETATAAAKAARADKKDVAAAAVSAPARGKTRPLVAAPSGAVVPAKGKKPSPASKSPALKAGKPSAPAVGKAAQPIVYRGCKIYTSVQSKCWRVLPIGTRIDKKFKWDDKPASTWKLLLAHCESVSGN